MAETFVYFLFAVIIYSGSIQAYFLSEDLETNLPDRFSDPIDENWQDKRSAENDYSSHSNRIDSFPNSKASMDFDYRNGNAEAQVNQMKDSDDFQEHESGTDGDVDESFNEADIRQIFSRLSTSDRQAFDGLMNDESPKIDVNKRQLLKQNFENSFHLNKRNNAKMCKGIRCDEYDPIFMNKESISEEGFNCPEKINYKRKFKRSHSFHSTPRENILQAKISILKDNYKRSSEMRQLEDSAKRRYNKRKMIDKVAKNESPE